MDHLNLNKFPNSGSTSSTLNTSFNKIFTSGSFDLFGMSVFWDNFNFTGTKDASQAQFSQSELQIVVGYGDGSIHCQAGRWRAERVHPMMRTGTYLNESFDQNIERN